MERVSVDGIQGIVEVSKVQKKNLKQITGIFKPDNLDEMRNLISYDGKHRKIVGLFTIEGVLKEWNFSIYINPNSRGDSLMFESTGVLGI